MNIYVASSWRNNRQSEVVEVLRASGYKVYDFKNPRAGDNGFHWSEIDPDWKRWSPEKYRHALDHPIAQDGFNSDFAAMRAADVCVLVLPCGRSAHIEAGWFVGCGKLLYILIEHGGHSYDDSPCGVCGDMDGCHGGVEPELMYRMADGGIATSIDDLVFRLETKDTKK